MATPGERSGDTNGRHPSPVRDVVDDRLLAELGLGGLPAGYRRLMKLYIHETLQFRVGRALARDCTDVELEHVELLVRRDGPHAALQWLRSSKPLYGAVLREEFGRLKEELRARSSQLIELSRTDPAVPGPGGRRPVRPAAPPGPLLPNPRRGWTR